MKTYLAKPGSRLSQADANILGPIIFGLAGDKGIQPEQVLDAARDELSPIHNYFEWNDGVAAEKYRIVQAAYILRNVVQLPVTPGGGGTPIRSFHLVHPDRNQDVLSDDEDYPAVRGVYMPIEIVNQDEALRREVTGRAAKELQSWVDKYTPFPELNGLVRPVKALLSKHQTKKPQAS